MAATSDIPRFGNFVLIDCGLPSPETTPGEGVE
jgi:hypothetical protein